MRRLWICVPLAALTLAGCSPSISEIRTNGIAEFQARHTDKAKAAFEEVLAAWPTDSESLYYMGRILQDEGQHGRAIFHYECCLNVRPGHRAASLWLNKAREEVTPRSSVEPAAP